ncbi:MAG: alpha/beta fold hydrolase [Silvanigrellaceae bacterium]
MSEPVKLGYRIFRFRGAGEALKFPVVLLRGLGRSSGFWLEFAEKLSEHAQVVCIDLLGTGLSASKWGRGSISGFASDVAFTLESLGFKQVHLVGISLGGMVAIEVGARSEVVAKLAVLASSSRGGNEKRIESEALFRLLWSLRKGTPANAELAPFLVSQETLKSRPELPAIWDELWQREGFRTLPVLRQLLAAALFDAGPALATMAKPIMFMVSKADALVPWRNTVALCEKSKNCELVVLEGYGHDFPTEAPDLVIGHLLEFFSR